MRRLGATDLDLLESLLDQHSESPFFVKNIDFRYVAANRAMARLCGLSNARELIGKRSADFFGTERGSYYEALDRSVLTEGRSLTNALELATLRDGGQSWLLFARVPVRDIQGGIVGVAANARLLPSGDAAEKCYRRLQTVTERLRRDFDQQVSLRDVANRIGISMTQLERDFRKVFDMTPSEFLASLRLECSKRLLSDKAMSVASVAYACGYTDHSAFARRFMERMGVTPTEYRRGLQSRLLS